RRSYRSMWRGTRASWDWPCAGHSISPLPELGKDVVPGLHDRVAREPALGVVPLRRIVSQGAWRERVGLDVIVEHGISPSAAVCEPLAVFHHEVDVMQSTR